MSSGWSCSNYTVVCRTYSAEGFKNHVNKIITWGKLKMLCRTKSWLAKGTNTAGFYFTVALTTDPVCMITLWQTASDASRDIYVIVGIAIH